MSNTPLPVRLPGVDEVLGGHILLEQLSPPRRHSTDGASLSFSARPITPLITASFPLSNTRSYVVPSRSFRHWSPLQLHDHDVLGTISEDRTTDPNLDAPPLLSSTSSSSRARCSGLSPGAIDTTQGFSTTAAQASSPAGVRVLKETEILLHDPVEITPNKLQRATPSTTAFATVPKVTSINSDSLRCATLTKTSPLSSSATDISERRRRHEKQEPYPTKRPVAAPQNRCLSSPGRGVVRKSSELPDRVRKALDLHLPLLNMKTEHGIPLLYRGLGTFWLPQSYSDTCVNTEIPNVQHSNPSFFYWNPLSLVSEKLFCFTVGCLKRLENHEVGRKLRRVVTHSGSTDSPERMFWMVASIYGCSRCEEDSRVRGYERIVAWDPRLLAKLPYALRREFPGSEVVEGSFVLANLVPSQYYFSLGSFEVLGRVNDHDGRLESYDHQNKYIISASVRDWIKRLETEDSSDSVDFRA